jgi:NTP pyrophosphatase (non-canonical NTP hydrolase)
VSEPAISSADLGAGFDLRAAARHAIATRLDRDWEQFRTPKNLATDLSVRATDLLELFSWADAPAAEVRADDAQLARVREVVADLVLDLITLANDLEIALAAALDDRLATPSGRA